MDARGSIRIRRTTFSDRARRRERPRESAAVVARASRRGAPRRGLVDEANRVSPRSLRRRRRLLRASSEHEARCAREDRTLPSLATARWRVVWRPRPPDFHRIAGAFYDLATPVQPWIRETLDVFLSH